MTHPALDDYVARLERAIADPADRAEAVDGVRSYVDESLVDDPTLATDAGVRTLLDRFGTPEEIAAGYRPGPAASRAAEPDPVLAAAVADRLIENRRATAAKVAVIAAGISFLLGPFGVLLPLAVVMAGIGVWGISRRAVHRKAYVATTVLAVLSIAATLILVWGFARSSNPIAPDLPGFSTGDSSSSESTLVPAPSEGTPSPDPAGPSLTPGPLTGTVSLEPVPTPTT